MVKKMSYVGVSERVSMSVFGVRRRTKAVLGGDCAGAKALTMVKSDTVPIAAYAFGTLVVRSKWTRAGYLESCRGETATGHKVGSEAIRRMWRRRCEIFYSPPCLPVIFRGWFKSSTASKKTYVTSVHNLKESATSAVTFEELAKAPLTTDSPERQSTLPFVGTVVPEQPCLLVVRLVVKSSSCR